MRLSHVEIPYKQGWAVSWFSCFPAFLLSCFLAFSFPGFPGFLLFWFPVCYKIGSFWFKNDVASSVFLRHHSITSRYFSYSVCEVVSIMQVQNRGRVLFFAVRVASVWRKNVKRAAFMNTITITMDLLWTLFSIIIIIVLCVIIDFLTFFYPFHHRHYWFLSLWCLLNNLLDKEI